MSKPKCPSCESANVRFTLKKKIFVCNRCGHSWKK
jgi:ribosomal protein L37AE/L43A